MEKRVVIRAYNKVWKMDSRIYAFQNIVLPVPISWREVGYFAVAAATMLVLQVIIPLVQYIPSVLRFIVIPFMVTQFLLKKKLDGKPPIKYLIAWIKYITSRDDYIERFTLYTGKKTEKIKIEWFCSQGCTTKAPKEEIEPVVSQEPVKVLIRPAEEATRMEELEPDTEVEAPSVPASVTASTPAQGRHFGREKKAPAIQVPKKGQPKLTNRKEQEKKVDIEKVISKVILGAVLAVFLVVMILSAMK